MLLPICVDTNAFQEDRATARGGFPASALPGRDRDRPSRKREGEVIEGRRISFALLALFLTALAVPATADEPTPPAVSSSLPPRLIHIGEPALRESSGLGVSRRSPDRFWTHNDSGDQPRLFAFDADGKITGRCNLIDADASDWEDMACFRDDKSRILVADCGDNRVRRSHITLYIFDEPDPNEFTNVTAYQTIRVSYSDGPQNCEAIAVDMTRRQIILIAKTALPFAGIYSIPLPARQTLGDETETLNVTASRVGTLGIPMISAMDIDSVSGDIWVVNYFQSFRFPSLAGDDLVATQLAAVPEAFSLPKWRQIEAMAVDDHHDVWLTSEGSPAPFGKLEKGDR